MQQVPDGQQKGDKGTSAKGETEEQVVIIEEKIVHSNGEQSIRKYTRGKFLGKGGFAKCYEVTGHDTKRTLAAKIILKSSLTKGRAKQKLLSEIKIHKSLSHKNIVKFEHVFEDTENVYILLEVCSNQTLSDLIKRRKRLHELEVQCYTVQMLNALKFCRENRVIHRDLKLGNLFLNEKMELKVADFGLAAKLEHEDEKRKTICGTPNYIAPEVLDGKVGHSYEVDIWSVGVIIYTMIIGKPPFETPDVKTTYKKIRQNQYSFPESASISENAKDLISKILQLEPSKRLTIEEILAHPFFNTGGTIPAFLPVSTLACPPSASYISQHATQMKGFPRNYDGTPTSKDLFGTDRTPSTRTNQDGLKSGSTMNLNIATSVNSQAIMQTMKEGKSESTKNFAAKGIELGGAGAANYVPVKQTRDEISVKKWVDYSTKYGVGYFLSNGSYGVFFNDSTKVILDPNGENFEYIDRNPSSKVEEVKSHTMSNYPKDLLHKKVVLLQHFKNYLTGEPAPKEPFPPLDEESKKEGMVYVKKWLKTKHAVMFRLNNKNVQFIFTDKTEIILSSEHKIVTYTDKKGAKSQYPLATAMESTNLEMAKRLKYSRDILTSVLNPAGKEKQTEADENIQAKGVV